MYICETTEEFSIDCGCSIRAKLPINFYCMGYHEATTKCSVFSMSLNAIMKFISTRSMWFTITTASLAVPVRYKLLQ